MVTPIKPGRFYTLSREVEGNAALNRAMLELFGIAIPWSIMANNKHERTERYFKAFTYFGFAFLVPFIILPFSNRLASRAFKLTNSVFKDQGQKILQIPYKTLHSSQDMEKDIQTLSQNLGVDLVKAKELLKSSPDKLRKQIIKAKSAVAGFDIFCTSLLLASVPFAVNEFTRLKTGRTGFSAEFSMASQDYVTKKAETHEKYKELKYLINVGKTVLVGALAYKSLSSAFLKNNPGKYLKKIKQMAPMFDFKKGIYTQKFPLFLEFLIGIQLSLLLAARDSHERKDTIIRSAIVDTCFFLVEPFLNGVIGKKMDQSMGTKIMKPIDPTIQQSSIKTIFPSIYSLQDLEKQFREAHNRNNLQALSTLRKTQKAALGMYWFNFLFTMVLLGFGTPKIINKIIKKDVKKGESRLWDPKQDQEQKTKVVFAGMENKALSS